MLRGEPIWHTSSTGPMSMPSSSEAVATSARRSPARSRVSTRRRRSFDREPWWAATTSSPRRSPSWWARRSASRRVLTNTSVVRCSATSAATRSSTSFICSAEAMASSSPSGSSRPEVEVALVARRRPPAGSGRSPTSSRPTVSIGRWVADRPTRVRSPLAQGLEPFEGEGQVGAALVAGHGVDLVDDDRLDRLQRLAAAVAGDQQVQRLGRGDHEGGRPADHRRPLGRRGVAGAHAHPDRRRVEPQLGGHRRDLVERPLQVVGDVDGQGLERRHVGHPGGGAHVVAAPRAPGRGRRWRRGSRPASCPSRWGRRPACCGPRR